MSAKLTIEEATQITEVARMIFVNICGKSNRSIEDSIKQAFDMAAKFENQASNLISTVAKMQAASSVETTK